MVNLHLFRAVSVGLLTLDLMLFVPCLCKRKLDLSILMCKTKQLLDLLYIAKLVYILVHLVVHNLLMLYKHLKALCRI